MSRQFTTRIAALAATIWLLAAFSIAGAADDRNTSRQELSDDAKLEVKVTLSTGPTTLAKVLEQLSSKIGESVIATDAIKDRRMTADFVDVSARQFLDTIGDMYDWRWYRQQAGVYVLDRRTVRVPTKPSEIPAAMQSVLPTEIRRYFKLPDLKTKDPSTRTMNSAFFVTNVGFGPLARLKSSLTDYFMRNDSLAVRDLSTQQRNDLLTWLFFGRMISTMEILHNDDGPHRYESAQFVIEFKNGMLSVVTNPSIVPGSGFGTQVFRPDGPVVPVDYGRANP